MLSLHLHTLGKRPSHLLQRSTSMNACIVCSGSTNTKSEGRWRQQINLKINVLYYLIPLYRVSQEERTKFGRVFLTLNYTDITQNTYIQSWTVTEIMAIEKCGLLGCPRTVSRPWRHTHTLRMLGNEKPLNNIGMQWPWRDNGQLRPA